MSRFEKNLVALLKEYSLCQIARIVKRKFVLQGKFNFLLVCILAFVVSQFLRLRL